jgi:primosomal protein N' (replication factor Y)
LYKTNHPTILHVRAHDYISFYKEELDMRKEFLYPPFTRLIKITLKHKKQEIVLEAANMLAKGMVENPKIVVFGPAEPPIARVRNLYLQEILLKINKDTNIIQQLKNDLKHKIALLTTTKSFSQVQVILDVDPY